jgi:hypothetical protein
VSSGGTINLAAGTYAGGLNVTKNVDIVGTSSDGSLDAVTTTINGGEFGVEIEFGSTVTITNVVISGTSADGIENHGTATLDNDSVTGNVGDDDGSGIFSGFLLVMNGGSVTQNTATDGSVGAGFDINGGTATFNNVSFTHNAATGEGGAIFNYEGTVHLTGTTSLHNNSSAIDGGGIETCPGQTTTTEPKVSVTGNTPNNISTANPGNQC